MDVEARDYLCCLEFDFNIDAQLAAILALLKQHVKANRGLLPVDHDSTIPIVNFPRS
jgi:hypothetical protein